MTRALTASRLIMKLSMARKKRTNGSAYDTMASYALFPTGHIEMSKPIRRNRVIQIGVKCVNATIREQGDEVSLFGNPGQCFLVQHFALLWIDIVVGVDQPIADLFIARIIVGTEFKVIAYRRRRVHHPMRTPRDRTSTRLNSNH